MGIEWFAFFIDVLDSKSNCESLDHVRAILVVFKGLTWVWIFCWVNNLLLRGLLYIVISVHDLVFLMSGIV